MNSRVWLRRAGVTFWGAWILFAAGFFFIRFSAIVYGQQKEVIDPILKKAHISLPASFGVGQTRR